MLPYIRLKEDNFQQIEYLNLKQMFFINCGKMQRIEQIIDIVFENVITEFTAVYIFD